jgi:hypothetical protein
MRMIYPNQRHMMYEEALSVLAMSAFALSAFFSSTFSVFEAIEDIVIK